LQKQRHLFKGWCIASNRITNDLEPLGRSMDAPVLRAHGMVRKPRLKFFDQVINLFDAKPAEIAMIGDKLFADIWGAKRAGMVTVWVEHIGPDLPWDRLLRTRSRERKILKKYLEHDR
jgi:predicted HAD superfamily phosphohydrolase YqeG